MNPGLGTNSPDGNLRIDNHSGNYNDGLLTGGELINLKTMIMMYTFYIMHQR